MNKVFTYVYAGNTHQDVHFDVQVITLLLRNKYLKLYKSLNFIVFVFTSLLSFLVNKHSEFIEEERIKLTLYKYLPCCGNKYIFFDREE